DKCLQKYLTAFLLKMHYDEMTQALYYVAKFVAQEDTDDIDDDKPSKNGTEIDTPQATLKRIIEFVSLYNVNEIWFINVGNSFQIKLIPTQWYIENENGSEEPFLQADKFEDNLNVTIMQNSSSAKMYLYNFDQGEKDFHENNLTILEQKAIYRELYSIYKKALSKALQDNLKSQQLISLLQEFIKENNSGQSDSGESLQTDNANDKNKDSKIFNLKNLKKHHSRR
ncbi:17837_t:CDS:2, partial [Cetraspora pellucida]